jgi:putative FmdB family regulatory protein
MQYDYRCPDCKAEITVERKMTDEPRIPSCFDCHIPMIRKFDAPVVQFKGKGFYSNGG